MGEHHAARFAGGARGVLQQRQRVSVYGGKRRAVSLVHQRLDIHPRHIAQHRIAPYRWRVTLRHACAYRRRHQRHARARVFEHAWNTRVGPSRIGWIPGHRHHTGQQAAEDGYHKIETGRQQHGHPIAGRGHREQSRGEPTRALLQLVIGERPALVSVVAQHAKGDGVRRVRCAIRQHLHERGNAGALQIIVVQRHCQRATHVPLGSLARRWCRRTRRNWTSPPRGGRSAPCAARSRA